MSVQANTRRIHGGEVGCEWINCPGVKISSGTPRVRLTAEELKARDEANYRECVRNSFGGNA